MSTLAYGRVDRIGMEQAQVKKLENNSVHQQLAYPPIVQKSTTLSTISESKVEMILPPLRPSLAPPSSPFDPSLPFAVDEGFSRISSLVDEIQCELKDPGVKENYHLMVIDLHNMVEELTAKHLAFISKQIREDSNELEKLNMKKTEEIRKKAEEVKASDTWSFFSTIAEYFSYAISITAGVALVATGVGTVAGSFLIAAGGLGLANRIMSDTKAWNSIVSYFTKSRDMQEKISHWISTSLLFVSMGIGLIGGSAAFQSGGLRLIDAALGTERAIEKLAVAGNLAASGIKVGEECTKKEMGNTLAALKILEGKLFLVRQQLQTNASDAKKAIETMQTLTRETKEAIASIG